jgi:uncharacterized protein
VASPLHDRRPFVSALHRYPVKSLLGEHLSALDLDERGVVGDRRWSVRDQQGKIGSGKSTRRFAAVPGLQMARATQTDGAVVVTLPDGSEHAASSTVLHGHLSTLFGQPVMLMPESGVSHFDDGPVSLLALASVDAVAEHRGERVDVARFRPNLVVDGISAFGEEQWIGRRLRIGTAVVLVQMASLRCRMVDEATADLPAQPGNLLAVGRLNKARLGVIASVVRPGVVHVGDSVISD